MVYFSILHYILRFLIFGGNLMKFTKLSLVGAASAVALTFVAGTNLAIADGHKIKPI